MRQPKNPACPAGFCHLAPFAKFIMPIIRVASLAFEDQDMSSWSALVGEHFARSTEIPVKHVSVIWQIIPGGHYAHAGRISQFQSHQSHPIIVEIMLPDFYTLERVDKIIYSSVDAISLVSRMPKENIFVQVNRARSGAVFDDGRIARW
jgi:hypothetical protein